MDRTLILVKPDAFGRGLTGEVIARFERKRLQIVALKMMRLERELAERRSGATQAPPDGASSSEHRPLPLSESEERRPRAL